ncbi:MAG: hypothetical protein J6V23_06955 [Bacteroidaceae bacterium]|nr:hypothetical protein [Bacteroidaceae bacterium]
MFILGFMTGTVFGVVLVAFLRANKPEDVEYELQKSHSNGYDEGYDKGYKDGMSDGYTLKR